MYAWETMELQEEEKKFSLNWSTPKATRILSVRFNNVFKCEAFS